MKHLPTLATLCLFLFGAFTSAFATIDSLIVSCVVIDEETQTPVSADIRYELEPYGSKIGFRKGSECVFRMEQGEIYKITILADGYLPKTINLDYKDYFGAGSITEEIALKASGVGKVMRLESLVFAQGSDVISSAAYDELNKLVTLMKESPTMKIQLEGHTDYRGDAKLNMKLSEDRVKATRDYLTNKGIDKSRIQVKAFGGTKPLSTENNPDAHALNRRVEVRILSN